MIKVDFLNKTDFEIKSADIEDIFSRLAQIRLTDKNVLIEVMAVSLSEIAKLNEKYLKHKGSTDVISFPNTNPTEDRNILLGSIIFSPEYLSSHNEETKEILEHGFMHLMGFDHEHNKKEWDLKLAELRNDLSKISN